MPIRMQAVDKEHPERVAIVRGPVAMVMEGLWQETQFKLPRADAEFDAMLVPDPMPGYCRVRRPGAARSIRGSVRFIRKLSADRTTCISTSSRYLWCSGSSRTNAVVNWYSRYDRARLRGVLMLQSGSCSRLL